MSEMIVINPENTVKGVKRKKKRSANQIAKKHARSNEHRHGTELDSDTYQYMVRILDMLREDFPSIDEKLIFVNNVYEQTIGREIEYAKNQVGSRVLDSMINYANCNAVQRLADALSKSLRPLCNDRFASHVLEKIILVCTKRGNCCKGSDNESNDSSNAKDSIKVSDDDKPKYNDIALKLCRYVINNFEEFVWDIYANHVLRTIFQCLGGVLYEEEELGRKKRIPDFKKRTAVAKEYTDLLIDAGNRIVKWPQFTEFGKGEVTSGLLQTILYSLKGIDNKLNACIIKKIIDECFTENTGEELSTIFHSESSVRLLEVCLAVAKPKMFARIYRKLFVGRLKTLSLMSSANFSVQRLLDHCNENEVFEEIFTELSDHFGVILDRKNTGIFASLANACLRLQCKQGPFINSLTKSLNCDESATAQLRIVPVVAALQNYEKVVERQKDSTEKIVVNLHGSIVLQAMLKFNKPIKIVNSLLAMSGEDLVALFSDPKGSRILDAFIDSKFIGEKSREKLAKTLKGNWVNLACEIHGSRCLDKIWQWAKTNQRLWIMEELASVGESLYATKTGKLISAKLNVPLFARNKKEWSETQNKQEKTKALFASIIGSPAVKTESKDSKKL